MNIEDMTPEQLREYALAKENQREAITARYMDRKPAPVVQVSPAKPWEREVEFEGKAYRVDMRRMKSREFVRMFAEFQKHLNRGEEAPISDSLAIYDYVFGGEVDDRVCEVVRAKMGYEDFEEIMRIENALLEACNVKN